MKIYAIVIVAVLLCGSIIGVGWAFSSATEISAEQPVKVVEYQHKGSFDHTATVRPSYFYDGEAPPTPEPSPQIPVSFIREFDMAYNYSSVEDAVINVQINAILESPGAWRKVINQVPGKDVAAGEEVPFSLDLTYFQSVAAVIEEEIGTNSSSYDLTVQAVVTGEKTGNFVQTLPIKLTRFFLKIGDDLIYSDGGTEGRFSYQVKLAENTLFGAVTLTSPAVTPTPSKELGQGDTIFTRFIDKIQVDFNYHLESNKPVSNSTEEVNIEAVLENPGYWSKTYTLIPPSEKTGDFSIIFPIDLNQFNSVFDTIQQETGIPASEQSLTLRATVHTKAQTQSGNIDNIFTQSIQTDLKEGMLTWEGELDKSEPGSIEVPVIVTEDARILSLPVWWIRYISILVAATIAVIFLYCMLSYFRSRRNQDLATEIEARQLGQKHKELIVEVKEMPAARPGEGVLSVQSFEDLLKVSQSLLKPVNHKAEPAGHSYWIVDGSTRYEYRLESGRAPGREVRRPDIESRE